MSPRAEKKKKTQKDRLRHAVEQTTAVLDAEKPEDEQEEVHTIEIDTVRRALQRDRNTGRTFIALELLEPDPNQVRTVDTKSESFDELVESVRGHGVIQPILVRWIADREVFQIVTGHRRYYAAKRAGLKTIAAVRQDIDDTEKAVVQLVENLQRESMNPVEEANAFHQYIVATGATQRDLARKIGKSPAYVSGLMSLLEKLDRSEQEEISKVPPAERPGKSLILEALRTEDSEIRLSILRGEVTRSEARALVQKTQKKRAVGRPKNWHRRIAVDEYDATVTITFRKPDPSREEVEKAIMEAYHLYEVSEREKEEGSVKKKR